MESYIIFAIFVVENMRIVLTVESERIPLFFKLIGTNKKGLNPVKDKSPKTAKAILINCGKFTVAKLVFLFCTCKFARLIF